MLFYSSTMHCYAADAEGSAEDDIGPKRKGRRPKTDSTDPDLQSAAPPEAKASRKGRRPKAEAEKWERLAAEALGFEAEAAGATTGAFSGVIPQQQQQQTQAMTEIVPTAAGAAAMVAPAAGPGSWAEAAATTAGEEDRRRFPYHRCRFRRATSSFDFSVELMAGCCLAGSSS
jgi:hypothetical protein